MIVKALEIRDRGTLIPVLAIDTLPTNMRQGRVLRYAGYSSRQILVALIAGGKGAACCDPYDWLEGFGRTMKIAHMYIAERFDDLSDGDVIDVEFLLGETKSPANSEIQLQRPIQ